jgi:hypothetical protein
MFCALSFSCKMLFAFAKNVKIGMNFAGGAARLCSDFKAN